MEEQKVSRFKRFEDDPDSTTLWVVFMPEAVDNDDFRMYQVLKEMPGKKLYISFLNRESYNSHDPETHRLGVEGPMNYVKEVLASHKINRVLCWGYSRGAYFAILIGQLLRFDRVVAISPEIALGEPESRSHKLMSNTYEPYSNLLPFMEAFDGEAMDIIVPCFSAREGINVQLASTVRNKRCRVHYFAGEHHIQRKIEKGVNIKKMVEDVYDCRDLTMPKRWLASPTDIAIAKASYDLLCALARNEKDLPLIDDSTSSNFEWFLLKSKIFFKRNDILSSIAAAERSLALHSRSAPNWVHIAKLYLKVGALDKAKDAAEKAQSINGRLTAVKEINERVAKALAAKGKGAALDSKAEAA